MTDRFIVVDDHPLFRAALAQVLAECATITEAGGIEELLATLRQGPEVDLVLLDLNLPGTQGYSGLLLVRAEFPHVPVMIVSAVSEPAVSRRCLELGASGYLTKTSSPAVIREAVETVLRGEVWAPVSAAGERPEDSPVWRRLSSLSAQQVRVLMMLSSGLMNKQIAHELSIAEATVKVHVSAVLQKLGVDSRTQAAVLARSLEHPLAGNSEPRPRE